ncbi:MAG: class I SAM-dependent methyltransferase, partial [Armatimonadetes bacterium]|nr:class I SAM-dependent methyltransferase [Anaerolineae bacterium]
MVFNPLAQTYDHDFTDAPIARWLRGRVQARLTQHFPPGARVLELGCGTGEDAAYLAARGVRVLATDASPAMLDAARRKNQASALVDYALLDLAHLPEADWGQFDGAYANFGVLNCLADWRPLAAWLAARIVPGGVIAFGVMSPYCAWEVAWYAAHGDFRTATRRWRRSAAFTPPDAPTTQ